MVAVPRLQQPAVHQVQNLGFRRIAVHAGSRRAGRDDGVVVRNLRVIDVALAERSRPRSLGYEPAVEIASHASRNGWQLVLDCRREMAAVRSRVGDRLVLLVQQLRQFQRPVRAESVQAVGVPLQFREVVEQGRRQPLGGLPHGLHIRVAEPGALQDRRGLLAVRGEARLALALLDAEVRSAIHAGLAGIELGLDLHVVLRNEISNRELPLHQHCQRGRLDPADREHFRTAVVPRPVVERVGPREIHSDQPVGSASGTGGIRQRVKLSRRPELRESAADRAGRQGRDPQPVHRFRAPCRLVELTEDQLAFPPGIRCAHHPPDPRTREDLLDHFELIAAVLVDNQRPFARQDGQRPTPPRLPVGIDLVRLGEVHQVADRPGNDQALAGEIAVSASAGSQYLRNVAGNRWLFGDYRAYVGCLPLHSS